MYYNYRMNNLFGLRLKQLRSTLNISQEEIAKKLNIPSHAYLNYETGKAQPKTGFLQNLRKTYNVNINWLLDGNGSPFNSLNFSEEILENHKLLEFFYYLNQYPIVQFSALASLESLKIKHPHLFKKNSNKKNNREVKDEKIKA